MKRDVFIISNNKEEVRQLRRTIIKINNKSKCFAYSDSIMALRRLFEVEVKPHLIILDLGMPLVGCKDWLMLLKSEPGIAEIPVVVYGDILYTYDRNVSISRYAYDYVIKPIPDNIMSEKLQRLLEPETPVNAGLKETFFRN